jgi:hypothetical protein
MIRYFGWAIAEKTLSYVPGGGKLYRAAGSLAQRDVGTRTNVSSAWRLVTQARDLPAGSTVVDMGTGWFHNLAFLLYILGDYRIILFDIRDKANLHHIRTYLGCLVADADRVGSLLGVEAEVVHRRLGPLLDLTSREAIYERCGFQPMITSDPVRPPLERGSVDLMVSYCVLGHIPPAVLGPELDALRETLSDRGRMYHMIGHVDHWTYHDPGVNRFNYYRYSDRSYGRLFDTKFEYQNRMVKAEWLELFDRHKLAVVDYFDDLTDDSRQAIAELPEIADRFAKHPPEELAIERSFVLLERG